MSTIALYKDKIGSAGGLLGTLSRKSGDLDTQLDTLKKTLQGVSSSTCNLNSTISNISTSAKSVSAKAEKVKKLSEKLDAFIQLAGKKDSSASEEINRSKDDFYTKYAWLKPDCEKSTYEKVKDGLKSIGEWCCDHWKLIVTAVMVIAAVAVLFIPGVGPIISGICWGIIGGALSGGLIGGAMSALQGGSFLEGFENGAFSGAIMGGICGGLGAAGAFLGKSISCVSTLGKFVKGTALVTKILSAGMGAFDTLALADGTLGLFGGKISEINSVLHSNPFYNALQIGVTFTAAFTSGMESTMTCFIAGTLVATMIGLVAIENIHKGDMVLSADAADLSQRYNRVLKTIRFKTKSLIHLRVNGEIIITTSNHPFYVKDRGFINAGCLFIGAPLVTSKNETVLIEEIIRESINNREVDVYNIEVEADHTYFIGKQNILVHNAGCKVGPNGEIEITDWDGYPEDGPKPDGELKLIDGDDYDAARTAANRENASIHKNNPALKGKDIHEVQPVKFNGSPTDHSNKICLTRAEHARYTKFWNTIQKQVEHMGGKE